MLEIEEPLGFSEDFSTEHALRMLDFYCKTLESRGYTSHAYPEIETRLGGKKFDTPKFETLCHAMWMCDRTREFLRAGRFAKVYRWIGMVQGILFMNGVFSLAELKEHNRFAIPDAVPYRDRR
ncbi:MAG: hypothetical protein CVT66_01530 [Actinobacteria bacterium HGW-Actinobacteria-6]|jgi:hypothetical protein|nr:MAG: hypothetical protein CVT66_01530 [Actinobacteria bacterium HGW-Actinobacteria-6]